MSNILLLFKFRPEHIEQIREAAPDYTITSSSADKLDAEQLRSAEIVCGWHPSLSQVIEDGSKLKWVQTSSAGIDRLPLDELEKQGVFVTSASGIHPISMAETFFAMLLAFSRNLHHAIRHQAKREWSPSQQYEQLAGKTIGIIGVGTIGTEMARLAQAFGMHVLGVRRSGAPVTVVDEMMSMDGLDEVLSRSDVIVNVLPYTDATHYLFGAERFKLMKPNALFFNFGRGPSVDTDALVTALQDGTIAGAGLDVFETEPLASDHPLWEMDNVIITPHIGGWTDQYKQKMLDIFLPNLRAFVANGQPTVNLVDYKVSY